jgi:hypothetical protein
MSIFSHEEIALLWEAAVTAGLSRSVLLSGLDPRLRATLPDGGPHGEQVMSDLHELNRMGQLPTGVVPVAVWIHSAAVMAGPRAEASIFHWAAAQLRDRLKPSSVFPVAMPTGGQPAGGPTLRSTAFVLVAVIAVASASGLLALAVTRHGAPTDPPGDDEPPPSEPAPIAPTGAPVPLVVPSVVPTPPPRPTVKPWQPERDGRSCAVQLASGLAESAPPDFAYPLTRADLSAPELAPVELLETGVGSGRVLYGVAPTRALAEMVRVSIKRGTLGPFCDTSFVDNIRNTGRLIAR